MLASRMAPAGASPSFHRDPIAPRRRPLGKRSVDIVAAAILIVLFAPVMLLAALAVKLSSPGPVLFRHSRVGRNGREFPMLKFRSMRTDAEELLARDERLGRLYVDGDHKIPSAVDPRVTAVGRLLRTWSVDELPQLFNVLAGHMSLVGPRPVVRAELAAYGDRAPEYLAVRPGLTGLWQVSGRSEVKFPARAELDAEYCARSSPLLDLAILIRTPVAVLRRRGAE